MVNTITKSGTNGFHGDVFEFLRNDKLDASDWFANAKGLARPELRQNDFGGVFGGPIRKDKLFFFGGYQGTTTRQTPLAVQAFVPTAAMKMGDFSVFASKNR